MNNSVPISEPTLEKLNRYANNSKKEAELILSEALDAYLERVSQPFPTKTVFTCDDIKKYLYDGEVEKHFRVMSQLPEPLDYHSASQINLAALERELHELP